MNKNKNKNKKYKYQFCNDILDELDLLVVDETAKGELEKIYELLDMIEDLNGIIK